MLVRPGGVDDDHANVTCHLKGWGVQTTQCTPRGTAMAMYTGEYVTTSEAQRRLAQYDANGMGHALLVRFPQTSAGVVAVLVGRPWHKGLTSDC